MIKVNLLRSRVQDTPTSAGTSLGGGGSEAREGLVKIVAILIFPIALMLYESQNIRALNEEQNRLQAQVNKLQTDLAAKNTEADKLKDVELQAKELEDKLKIFKLLSKLRLRHVKTLDFVQSSIPEKVWLKTVNYDSDKARVDSGHFQISGFATATEELTEFVRRLDDSAYLTDVIVVKNQEVQSTKQTSLREFVFTAEVENRN